MPSARREKRSEMTMAATKGKRERRAELRAWYLCGLLPKLARAASNGAVDARAVVALDTDLRTMLELSRERKEAA